MGCGCGKPANAVSPEERKAQRLAAREAMLLRKQARDAERAARRQQGR